VIHALPPAIVAGELVRLQTRQQVVALTFDGGGNADAAKRVLAIQAGERARYVLPHRTLRPDISAAVARDRTSVLGRESHGRPSRPAAPVDPGGNKRDHTGGDDDPPRDRA